MIIGEDTITKIVADSWVHLNKDRMPNSCTSAHLTIDDVYMP